jgi:hypothetical protein
VLREAADSLERQEQPADSSDLDTKP